MGELWGLTRPPGPSLLCLQLSCQEKMFSHLWSPRAEPMPWQFRSVLWHLGSALGCGRSQGVLLGVQEPELLELSSFWWLLRVKQCGESWGAVEVVRDLWRSLLH